MMSSLNYATLMRARLKSNLLISTHTIDSIKLSLRNLVNAWMLVLLGLSPLSLTYVVVVRLLTLTMNVLDNCFMLLMIMFEV
jgi:hypothetical protein